MWKYERQNNKRLYFITCYLTWRGRDWPIFRTLPLLRWRGNTANISRSAKALKHTALLSIYTMFYLQVLRDIACVMLLALHVLHLSAFSFSLVKWAQTFKCFTLSALTDWHRYSTTDPIRWQYQKWRTRYPTLAGGEKIHFHYVKKAPNHASVKQSTKWSSFTFTFNLELGNHFLLWSSTIGCKTLSDCDGKI